MLSNSRPHVSGTTNRMNTSVTTLTIPKMANVAASPIVLMIDKNVSDNAKFATPDASVATATPLPLTRNGNTSDTRIHAIAPMLKAKHPM